MSTKTKISWCDSTINFWSGCTKISAGCQNCYAETLSHGFIGKNFGRWGNGQPRKLHESAFKLAEKLSKKPWVCPVCGHAMTQEQSMGYRGCPVFNSDGEVEIHMHVAQHHPRRIFSLSLGDWLDPEVPTEWLARMLDTIRRSRCNYLLLTKRTELFKSRMVEVMKHIENTGGESKLHSWVLDWISGASPNHIWIGASIENQQAADERIPHLLRMPAGKRFLSIEPLLGPLEFSDVSNRSDCVSMLGKPALQGIDWVIIGGESGPNRRPMEIEWLESIVQQCDAAKVPVFVKQDNGPKPGMQGRISDALWARKEMP